MTAVTVMTKRKDVSVKVDEAVINDARIAAAYKGISLAEYLSESLRPIVAKDIEEGHEKRKTPKVRKPKGGSS